MVLIGRFNSKFGVIQSFNLKNIVIQRLWIRIYIVNRSKNDHSWHSWHVIHRFDVIFRLNSRHSRHEKYMYFFDISLFLFLPLSTLMTYNQYIVCYLVLKLLTLTIWAINTFRFLCSYVLLNMYYTSLYSTQHLLLKVWKQHGVWWYYLL